MEIIDLSKEFEEWERREREAIDWCRSQVIKWRLIDTITIGRELLTEEGKVELEKALELADMCEHWGLSKRASYIRRRIREKMNYIENR